jgi:hypothetical protein
MSSRKDTKDILLAALKDAQKAPQKEELWDRIEEMAANQQRPDEVAELLRKLVRDSNKPELVDSLGRRAVRFHEEWFGATADALVEILTRVLEIDPTSDWGLKRLSVLFTVKERWTDLLALYDKALAAHEEVGRRKELLAEAAHVARDFAGEVDRAANYMIEQLRLQPTDGHLAAQIERLLERQGRWADLLSMWTSRLDVLKPEERRDLRVRMAGLRADRLEDPAGAIDEVDAAFADGAEDDAPLALLERVLREGKAPAPVRRRALERLRERYEATGRAQKIVPLLQVALEFSGKGDKAGHHRELSERLAREGKNAEAMAELVTLMALDPGAEDAQERLRHLGELESNFVPYARGLEGAAQSAADPVRRLDLWAEAARIHEEALQDVRGAIVLFRKAHLEEAGNPNVRLEATRKLAGLLARVPEAEEKQGERLGVLESLSDQIAAGAPAAPERRARTGRAPGRGAG